MEQTVADKTGVKSPEDLTLDELDELLEDDMDDERVLEQYRMRRMAEMKKIQQGQVFGVMHEITQADFVREVTEASQKHWVVCFLYKDGLPACNLLRALLQQVASDYPGTKFVSIIGNHCIPNYPDRNLPTLLIYGHGDLRKQLVGMAAIGGMNAGRRDVERLLESVGAISSHGVKSTGGDSRQQENYSDDDD